MLNGLITFSRIAICQPSGMTVAQSFNCGIQIKIEESDEAKASSGPLTVSEEYASRFQKVSNVSRSTQAFKLTPMFLQKHIKHFTAIWEEFGVPLLRDTEGVPIENWTPAQRCIHQVFPTMFTRGIHSEGDITDALKSLDPVSTLLDRFAEIHLQSMILRHTELQITSSVRPDRS